MALGGLPRLLSTLDGHFAFGRAKPLVIGKLPVWSLEGQWKPKVLATLLPDQREAILAGQPAQLDKLPPHLPHGVTLILGRDEVVPLFPYSISYYRFKPVGGDPSGATPASALARRRRVPEEVTTKDTKSTKDGIRRSFQTRDRLCH
jgi:hypothetical protein